MRDPIRIKRILNKIEAIWEYAPDLRFGQLIENLKPEDSSKFLGLFHIEDNIFEEELDEFIKIHNIKLSGGWKS